MDIPKNEIINKNKEKLLSKEFYNQLIRESIGGNAGEMHAGVNAHYNNLGEIVRFSNYQSDRQEGEKWVTFRVDVSYLAPKSKNDKYLIDGIYFENENNQDIKSVMENATEVVNKMPKKERQEYLENNLIERICDACNKKAKFKYVGLQSFGKDGNLPMYECGNCGTSYTVKKDLEGKVK